jgi:hypothetical protein
MEYVGMHDMSCNLTSADLRSCIFDTVFLSETVLCTCLRDKVSTAQSPVSFSSHLSVIVLEVIDFHCCVQNIYARVGYNN